MIRPTAVTMTRAHFSDYYTTFNAFSQAVRKSTYSQEEQSHFITTISQEFSESFASNQLT
jgi:hypothetical protein